MSNFCADIASGDFSGFSGTTPRGEIMAGKNKGGREAKKPKADAKKPKGTAPTTIPIVESMNKTGRPKK
jgi:hypothetical protein